ncbi:MAG: tetratricopeptide repeat protein [Cyanobacteria bacterium]|nr:tetratricopeptide repeat protein [Cyanobacteriota bacterium]
MSNMHSTEFGVITSTVLKQGGSSPSTEVYESTVPSDEFLGRIERDQTLSDTTKEALLTERLRYLVSSLGRAEEIVDAYSQLARHYLDQSNIAAAEQMLEEVLSYGRESYGAQHPAVAPLFIELAFVNYKRNNFTKAKLLLETALFIEEQAHGEVSEPVAFILHKLGRIQEALGNDSEAEQFYLRAVTVYENTFSEDESQIITARGDLARMRRKR